MFVTPAFAQAAGAATPGIMNSLFIPMILVLGIMYFLMIRPQQKKMKEDQAMRDAVRRGDQIITQGGLIGKVAKVHDNGELEVEIAQGVKVRILKSAVLQVLNKTEPAAS